MKLTPVELREHAVAYGIPEDPTRQTAFRTLDEKIRLRLPEIPANRYYTFHMLTGEITVSDRERPLPVKKISKSGQ